MGFNSGVAIVEKMTSAWHLSSEVCRGSGEINVKYKLMEPIERLQQFYVGGINSKSELVTVIDVIPYVGGGFQWFATLKLLNNLNNDHGENEIIVSTNNHEGIAFSDNNCFVVQSSICLPEHTIAHELLHLGAYANLHDVGVNNSDYNNLMFYQAGWSEDCILRFRSIDNVVTGTDKPSGTSEMQWDLIHGFSRAGGF